MAASDALRPWSDAPDPAAEPWPRYAQAVVELLLDGEHLVLTPLGADPHADGPTDEAGLGGPVWVLTAGDPYPITLAANENATRNAVLRDDLTVRGIDASPALGRSPDGSTSEVSLAVRGADRATVLELAARHGQLAVYEIEDRIRCVDVASGRVVSESAFHLDRAPAGSGALAGPTGWRG